MSDKTRIVVYRKSIGVDAQTLSDIITLSFICSIRKTRKLSIHLSKAISLVSFSYWRNFIFFIREVIYLLSY